MIPLIHIEYFWYIFQKMSLFFKFVFLWEPRFCQSFEEDLQLVIMCNHHILIEIIELFSILLEFEILSYYYYNLFQIIISVAFYTSFGIKYLTLYMQLSYEIIIYFLWLLSKHFPLFNSFMCVTFPMELNRTDNKLPIRLFLIYRLFCIETWKCWVLFMNI